MDGDEREIFYFLKSRGEEFVNAVEIARRASGKRKFHADPDWAKPILARMAERGILQSDVLGRYRVKPVAKKGKGKRWVSPDIAKILQESGVEVEGTDELGSDDYSSNCNHWSWFRRGTMKIAATNHFRPYLSCLPRS